MLFDIKVEALTIDMCCYHGLKYGPGIGQAIGPLWDFCAPISIVVEL